VTTGRDHLSWTRFLRWLLLGSALLLIAGYVPTVRLGGRSATVGMVVGCAISFLTSILGAVPLMCRTLASARTRAIVPLYAVGLRFAAALILGLSAVFFTSLAPVPLLIWVAVSHLAFLTIDVRFAFQVIANAET
jgi:hypothetical protein